MASPSKWRSTTSTRRSSFPTGKRWVSHRRSRQRRSKPAPQHRNCVPERPRKMSKELLLVVDAVANEKGVPESVIFEAIEAALASAAKKRYPDQDVLVRVQIDPKDGNYETYRRWEVVADDVVMESPDPQIRLMDAVDE